jgi:hypothetical protein
MSDKEAVIETDADFLARITGESVLQADQEPFVELWETDFVRLLALAKRPGEPSEEALHSQIAELEKRIRKAKRELKRGGEARDCIAYALDALSNPPQNTALSERNGE